MTQHTVRCPHCGIEFDFEMNPGEVARTLDDDDLDVDSEVEGADD